MIHLKTLTLIGASVLLTACATATPYEAASRPGASGYSSTQIENNRHAVSFSGNSLTDQETVETYLLYRAAELTVNSGYDYFTVAEKDTQEKTRVMSTGSSLGSRFGYGSAFHRGFHCSYDFYSPRFGWRSRIGALSASRMRGRSYPYGFGGRFRDPFFDDVNYREITQYKATANIRLHTGIKPSSDNAFDARQVMENLGPKVVFPETKSEN